MYYSLPTQRVSVIKMSEDEIIDLLASHDIVKRSPEEAEAEEDLEPWDNEEHEEL